MERKSLVGLVVSVLIVIAGCGGGPSRARDASPSQDGPAADVATDHAAGIDAAIDADAAADAHDATPKPLPVASPGSRVVVAAAAAGPVTLVGHGLDSCTNQLPSTGDRWCGFARPAAGTGFTELWVIDATKAAAGAAIACDGTDMSCFRLSTRLFKSTANGFADSGFNGDTLIYDEATFAGMTAAPFMGVVYAWRPGWTSGRALTSATGLYCVGQARSASALCFENPDGDGMVRNLTVELHAGGLASATGPPLPTLDTLLLAAPTDVPGSPPRYQFDLSPDGAYVAWSARATPTAAETLHTQKVDAAATERLVVAEGVSQWAMSPDGSAWYWLAGYNYDVTGAPSGTLRAAAFPDGSGATTLADGVGDFAVVGDKGLRFRADVATQVGTLRWMADRDAPTVLATIDTQVLTVLDEARDRSRFAYAKTYAPVRAGATAADSPALELVDLYVAAPAAAPCVVSATPTALQAALTPSGSVAVWERYDPVTGARQGVATTVSSCASTPFATDVRSLLPLGDDAYAYLDDADPAAAESTLRYARVVNGALVLGTPVQTRAASVFAPLPTLAAILYTVATGTAADGLYVVDPTSLVAAVDAGADATADAGSADAGDAE